MTIQATVVYAKCTPCNSKVRIYLDEHDNVVHSECTCISPCKNKCNVDWANVEMPKL